MPQVSLRPTTCVLPLYTRLDTPHSHNPPPPRVRGGTSHSLTPTTPLHQESEGVPEVLEVMNEYDLQRDDWDVIMELSTFSPAPNPATRLSTKTKTAFTR